MLHSTCSLCPSLVTTSLPLQKVHAGVGRGNEGWVWIVELGEFGRAFIFQSRGEGMKIEKKQEKKTTTGAGLLCKGPTPYEAGSRRAWDHFPYPRPSPFISSRPTAAWRQRPKPCCCNTSSWQRGRYCGQQTTQSSCTG